MTYINVLMKPFNINIQMCDIVHTNTNVMANKYIYIYIVFNKTTIQRAATNIYIYIYIYDSTESTLTIASPAKLPSQRPLPHK